MSGLKTGMDTVQTTLETLGHRVNEAETRISTLEDKDGARETAMNTAMRNLTQLQERVTYLEDAGRRNNVRIVGIEEGAEGNDVHGFVQKLISKTLDVELTQDFEIERSHRTGQRGGRDRHILVRFLRFTAREAVLRAAREKGRATWKGKPVSFFQDLSQDVIQKRKKFDGVKRKLQEKGLRYTMIYPAMLRFCFLVLVYLYAMSDILCDIIFHEKTNKKTITKKKKSQELTGQAHFLSYWVVGIFH
uniref:L1 transposable element RRM domain-containing protein n=1 Tax=Stegastes partitus TaxID=144197 RepID=A0A3B5B3W5_9TELE